MWTSLPMWYDWKKKRESQAVEVFVRFGQLHIFWSARQIIHLTEAFEVWAVRSSLWLLKLAWQRRCWISVEARQNKRKQYTPPLQEFQDRLHKPGKSRRMDWPKRQLRSGWWMHSLMSHKSQRYLEEFVSHLQLFNGQKWRSLCNSITVWSGLNATHQTDVRCLYFRHFLV